MLPPGFRGGRAGTWPRTPAAWTSRLPEGSPAANPAFDVTPAALIAAIVTEEGVHRAPFERSLPREPAAQGRSASWAVPVVD